MDINSQTLLRILSNAKNDVGQLVNEKRAEYNLTGRRLGEEEGDYELGYAEGTEEGLHIAIQILEAFER